MCLAVGFTAQIGTRRDHSEKREGLEDVFGHKQVTATWKAFLEFWRGSLEGHLQAASPAAKVLPPVPLFIRRIYFSGRGRSAQRAPMPTQAGQLRLDFGHASNFIIIFTQAHSFYLMIPEFSVNFSP